MAGARGQGQGQADPGRELKKDPPLVIQYISVLGDQAWRPFQECAWQALQPSRACRGLAERSTAPAYRNRGERGGGRV